MFPLKEVLKAVQGQWIFGDRQRQAIGVSTDSRTLRAGDLFIALKGDKFDGHCFLKEVVQKGAAALVISDEKEASGLGHVPIIVVSDTRRALGDLAHWHRQGFLGPVIAVTGSCGKTSTKEMIASILATRGPVLKSEGTQNNEIGVPWTLLRLRPEHWACVLELGMNHLGEIERLAQIALPHIGVITNISSAHLEGVGTLEQIAQAKCELIKVIGDSGTAILNGDDQLLMKYAASFSSKKLTFGWSQNCDIRLPEFTFPSSLSADFQRTNALAALAVAKLLGIPQEGALSVLSQWTPPKGRLQIRKGNGFWVIDDTYNANPLSTKVAIQFLRDFQTSGRRIAILADMLELGESASLWHWRLGQQSASMGFDRLILLGSFASDVQMGAIETGMDPQRIRIVKDHRSIIEFLNGELGSGDVVLVKGSRKMRMEEVVDGLFSHVLSSTLPVA